MDKSLEDIQSFLLCATPESWLQMAVSQQEMLLIDHANCEKKAASTALKLINRYFDRADLLYKMSRLAREELRHFEQVLGIMKKRGVGYKHVSASRYAASLLQHVRKNEPGKLVDSLIVGAYIEARSCERFACLAPYLDRELRKFYESLLKSESRHFKDYLGLAQSYSKEDIRPRVDFFAEHERELIESEDSEFRFHSGVFVG